MGDDILDPKDAMLDEELEEDGLPKIPELEGEDGGLDDEEEDVEDDY